MPLISFTSLVFLGSFVAGLVGALTGLGGGVVLIPLLTLVFHVDLRYAIGASLISVIATSSGAAAAYVREGISNVRIGMFLEVATTFGALFGAYLATRVPTRALAIVFGLVLIYSAWLSRSQKAHPPEKPHPNPWSDRLRMSGSYPVKGCGTEDGKVSYRVDRISAGFATMFGAGILSGLLGIGSGAVKVLAMDKIMRIPFKVSTTTSNFMIGVTAAASAGIYLARGYIDPGLAFPVMLGVLAGSLLGAKFLVRAKVSLLRTVFSIVILGLGVEMIVNGWLGEGVMAKFDDARMESMMGLLLRFGVVLASTVVLAGGVFYLQDHAGERADYRTFVAHSLSLRHPAELMSGIAHGHANAIIELGILLLVATPIARVVFAVVSFAIERDRLYVGISLTVLAVLLYGMFRGG